MAAEQKLIMPNRVKNEPIEIISILNSKIPRINKMNEKVLTNTKSDNNFEHSQRV